MLIRRILAAALLILVKSQGSKGQYQQQQTGTALPSSTDEESPENGIIEEPLVQCGVDSFSIEIRTVRPFSGRLFVKGFSQEQQCQLLGNGSKTQLQFSVHFGQCGLRRSREINGVSVQAIVVVSFHPIFITKLDRAYRLNCFYTEARKAVSQQLEVGQLTTSGNIHRQGTMPQCRYDILWQNAQGQSIKFARIGDTVYHRWSCNSDQPDVYCMRVHSCTVSDGQGGQAVEVLDRNGCGVDALLLRDLDYSSDLAAGQTASVFKFADKPTLHFNCQIELTLRDQLRGCDFSKPKCSPPTRPLHNPPPINNAKPPEAPSAAGAGGGYGNGGATATASSSSSRTPSQPINRQGANGSPSYGPPPNPTPSNLPPIRTAPSSSPTPTWPTAPPTLIVRETALPSVQFRVQPNRTTVSGQDLVPFTAATPATGDHGAARKQTQVPPSKLATEHYTTEESGESQGEAVGDWAQQDAIYQDEMNSQIHRRTPQQPRNRRGDIEKRIARKVADFDLPERSLVVIELDENSLAHQPLIWRLLNSSLPGIQCPASLANQIPHWTILLVLLFMIILLSALLWTNWPSREEAAGTTEPRRNGTNQREPQRIRRPLQQEEAEVEERRFTQEHLDLHGPSLRF